MYKHKQYHFLTEKDVIYAATQCLTNKDAANFLHVSYNMWRKYAKLYYEGNTGKSWFDYLKFKRRESQSHVKVRKSFFAKNINDIFDGKVPYSKHKLFKRIIKNGHMDECCQMCGFAERDFVTERVPLVLDCIDGNDTNLTRNNLRLLCYNCASLNGYEFRVKRSN